MLIVNRWQHMYDVLSPNAPLFLLSAHPFDAQQGQELFTYQVPSTEVRYVYNFFVWKNDANDTLCKMVEEGTTDDLRAISAPSYHSSWNIAS